MMLHTTMLPSPRFALGMTVGRGICRAARHTAITPREMNVLFQRE
jgi:hypothetical protein